MDESETARRREAGFTLIEIMVVVVILGLLATLVAQSVGDHADTARVEKARTDLSTIAGAARLYYGRRGHVPTIADLVEPDEHGRRYLDDLPDDPWGTPYELADGERAHDIVARSAGPDRVLGTEDDVSSRSGR